MTDCIVPPPERSDKQTFVYSPLTLLEQAYAELTARHNREEDEREEQERQAYGLCEGNLRNLLAGLFGSQLEARRPLRFFEYTLQNRNQGEAMFLCCELDGLRFAVSFNPFYATSLLLLLPCGDGWQIANGTDIRVLSDVAEVVEDWYDFLGLDNYGSEGDE